MGLMSDLGGFASDFLGDTANSAVNYHFQKKLDDRGRNWQQYMSNTQYQRGVADLKAAGLNPILAATGGLKGSHGSGSSGSFKSGQGISQQKRLINQQIATAKALSTKHLADAKLSGESAKVVGPIATGMEELNSALKAIQNFFGGTGAAGRGTSSALDHLKNITSDVPITLNSKKQKLGKKHLKYKLAGVPKDKRKTFDFK